MALPEIVPFPYEMDWSERFDEEREFETPIQEMRDGTEQRSSLSDVPNRRFSYTIKALEFEHDEYQRLLTAIRGGQALRWWVPYWPRERFVTGTVAAAAVSIPVATTDHMALVVGQGVLLYRGPTRFEVVLVTAINPTSISVTATTLSWRSKDKVIPCFRGLMAPQLSHTDHDVHMGSVQVTFDLEIHEE